MPLFIRHTAILNRPHWQVFLLFVGLDAFVFDRILIKLFDILLAFSATFFACIVYINLESIYGPRYLRHFLAIIFLSSTLSSIWLWVSVFVNMIISLFCSASYRSIFVNHLCVFSTVSVNIWSRVKYLWQPLWLQLRLQNIFSGSSMHSCSSYRTFHKVGPSIDPCVLLFCILFLYYWNSLLGP